MRSPLSQVRDEALLTLGFGAQFQNTLLPEQVHRELGGDSIGKLYSRDSVGFVDIARIVVKNQRVASFVEFNQLARNKGIQRCRTVFEKIHCAPHEWFFCEELNDPERFTADGQNVAATIF